MKLSEVVSIKEQMRQDYPFIYQLDCGHKFYGDKRRVNALYKLIQPKRIKCETCNVQK